ncbi:MAG: ATP-binding cassette domain-containing protein [Bacteroidales bacterium]|jgi:ABC-type multidrug transport system ATPase subunit|nr:ATP-binding cassette domain-containing protein [Bacteroidales bacterium]
MSEAILRAMMELFALIVKQDGGMLQSEMNYVSDFLNKQLPHKSASEYMRLFLENSGPLQVNKVKPDKETASVRDSVRIFNLCTQINKTLSQEQRVIALLRCFELIDYDKQYTPQRMNIINTIAEVFRVSQEEFNSIWLFVREEEKDKFGDPAVKLISDGSNSTGNSFFVFLRVASVNLYFVRSFFSGTTLLNGLPMTARKVYTFAQGSSVQAIPSFTVYYGDVTARYVSYADLHRLSFVADRLTYSFPDGSPAISDLSFSTSEGKLIGIMGASGTGKTTLLNLLSGLTKPASGDVRINGKSIFSQGNGLDGVIGFVPQDDLLVEELTVFENLFYAASLCLAGRSRNELTDIVNQTLNTLGLYEKRNYRVGSPLNKVISGGQRKRLNIALELVREPSVLFLDEPTSGLASRDSENVIDLLHDLTFKGKLVITVVHQPSSDIFKGFDNILVLDQSGHMVFYGNPIEAIVHFKTLDAQINNEIGECYSCGNVNSETLFNILESRILDEFGRDTDKRKISPAEWAEAYRKGHPVIPVSEVTTPAFSTLQRPSWWKQVLIYLSRDVRSKVANRQYLMLMLLEGPVLGLILSFIIRYIADPSSNVYVFRENENIPIYIFMSVIVALFLGLTISAEEIFRDRKILTREHFLNLSRGSYLLSKVSVLILISSLQTFLFLIVANPVLGIKGLFFTYWAALFTTAFCANMIGLNISSAFNSAITIYIVIPLLMIPMMVLSGAMFPFDKLNRKIGSVDKVPLIAEVMPPRWTYEALMVRQFTGNEYGRRVYPLRKQMSISDFNTIYRLPRIQEALEKAMITLEREGRISGEDNSLNLIRNELRTIASAGGLEPFYGQDSVTSALFTKELGIRTAGWLSDAEKEFRRISNNADLRLDAYVRDNRQVLNSLYDDYHNDKLEEIVRKVYEKNKILEYKERLIQNVDLIYLEPQNSDKLSFRTHFMAPVKSFFGYRPDTFTFNVLLVLFSTLILYILLYFEVLKRMVFFFGTPGIQKK